MEEHESLMNGAPAPFSGVENPMAPHRRKKQKERAGKENDWYARPEQHGEVEGDKQTQGQEPVTFTIQEAIDHIGFGWFQVKISIFTGICWMADSMEMMMLSILGPVLHCEWFLTSWEQALLTTLVMIGMAISAGPWGIMADKYGRKKTLVISCALCGYFGLLTALSPSYEWVAINRFLVGFTVGAFAQALTLYSEFLPTRSRALCMVYVEVFFAVGTGVEVILAKFIMPSLGWRYLIGATALPVLGFSVLSFWLPQSARFLLTSGQYVEAVAVLERIAKENGKSLPEGQLERIDSSKQDRGHVKDLFTPSLRRVSILLLSCWFVYGFCYFGMALLVPTLFTEPDGCHGSDIKKEDKDECGAECESFTQKDFNDLIITGFADVPGLLFVVALMSYLGRKKSIAICCSFFAFFVLLSNICMTRGWLTFLLFTARALLTGGFQAIYVYTSEVYPTPVRSLAMGICNGISRFGAVLTPYLAQVGTEANAYYSITGYGVIGIIASILTLLLPVETAGKAMEDKDPGYQSLEHHQLAPSSLTDEQPRWMGKTDRERDNDDKPAAPGENHGET